MESKNITELTDASFEQDVLKSDKLVLVDFWAPWCGPCKMLAPTLEQVAQDMTGKIQVCKMNIDENQDVASRFGVRSIPTMMLFKNGNPIETKIGALPKPTIEEWINSHLSS